MINSCLHKLETNSELRKELTRDVLVGTLQHAGTNFVIYSFIMTGNQPAYAVTLQRPWSIFWLKTGTISEKMRFAAAVLEQYTAQFYDLRGAAS